MKALLTTYYTFMLVHEVKVNGKCKTMKAQKLKTKLQGLNK